MRSLAAALVMSLAPGTVAQAQWGSVEAWGGLAWDSPSWGILGNVPEMNFALVGLRFSRLLGGGDGSTPSRMTEFSFDLVPVALTSPPYVSLRGAATPCPPRSLCALRPNVRSGGPFPEGSAYGFGVNPAGLTTRFRADRHVSPSLGLNVGGLWFDRHVPTSKSSRFNFTASLEAGLRVGPPDAAGVTITYRFHHLSNAGTAGENPGLASHLLSVGILSPRRRRAP